MEKKIRTQADVYTCGHARWAHVGSRGKCHTTVQHSVNRYGNHREMCACVQFGAAG